MALGSVTEMLRRTATQRYMPQAVEEAPCLLSGDVMTVAS